MQYMIAAGCKVYHVTDARSGCPGSKEDMVALAFNMGWVKTAKSRQDKLEADIINNIATP